MGKRMKQEQFLHYGGKEITAGKLAGDLLRMPRNLPVDFVILERDDSGMLDNVDSSNLVEYVALSRGYARIFIIKN